MGDQDKIDLLQLFSKKLNIIIGIVSIALSVFVVLFVAFMLKSSEKDGVHDTQIAQIFVMQEKREVQMDKLADLVGVLNTNDKLEQEEIGDLVKLLDDIIIRVKNAEFAILTDDPDVIIRGKPKNIN